MAWVSQELKRQLAPNIKAVLKKYGVKGTIAVRDNRVLVVNIKSGPIDFIGEYVGKFPSDYFNLSGDASEFFNGRSASLLSELFVAMNNGNWDKSDIMTDYFNVGWYTNVNIGRWSTPYQYIPA